MISWRWKLGDMHSAAEGCEIRVTICVKTAWKKFRDLLPVLTFRHLSCKTCGHVYSSCLWRAMLTANEAWPLTKMNSQRNDRAKIRQICSIKQEDVAMVRSYQLLAKLELVNLYLILREIRLNCFGHVEHSSGAVSTACDKQIYGRGGGVQANMEETDGERLL